MAQRLRVQRIVHGNDAGAEVFGLADLVQGPGVVRTSQESIPDRLAEGKRHQVLPRSGEDLLWRLEAFEQLGQAHRTKTRDAGEGEPIQEGVSVRWFQRLEGVEASSAHRRAVCRSTRGFGPIPARTPVGAGSEDHEQYLCGGMEPNYYSFEHLRNIMARLRAPDGCPWDKEQTHESIKEYFLEEVYEFLEAVETKDPAHMREELGDVLLQVVFHAQMGSEAGTFDLDQVIHELSDKLVRRHPHVFGEVAVSGSDEVVVNWDAIKNAEAGKETRKSRLDGIPTTFPALVRAKKLQLRAAKDGFDWPSAEPVWEKLEEEIKEVREAIAEGDADHLEDELGDLLFVVVNLARKLDVDPEIALQRANRKFEGRFRKMEAMVEARGQKLSDLDLVAQDALWDEAKKT